MGHHRSTMPGNRPPRRQPFPPRLCNSSASGMIDFSRTLSLQLLVGVLAFSAIDVSGGFAPPSIYRAASIGCTALLAQAEERSLYDVLGASPDETRESLRQRYTELAKKTHPDVFPRGVEGENGGHAADFATIAAAWSILGDPKERMKYDRELRAKKFAEGLEKLVDSGIRNAIPFLKKTADSTQIAMEMSAEIATDVHQRVRGINERLEVSRKISEVEKKKRELEHRASRHLKESEEFQAELDSLDDVRLVALKDDSSITAARATQLLNDFLPKSEQPSALKDAISSLEDDEQRLGAKNIEAIETENDVYQAEQQVLAAENSVKDAERLLEEAKMQLKQAKADFADSKKAVVTARHLEKTAQVELDKASSSINQRKEKVKSLLRGAESQMLEKRAVYVKQERGRLVSEAKELTLEAKKMGVLIKKLKNEEQMLKKQDMARP